MLMRKVTTDLEGPKLQPKLLVVGCRGCCPSCCFSPASLLPACWSAPLSPPAAAAGVVALVPVVDARPPSLGRSGSTPLRLRIETSFDADSWYIEMKPLADELSLPPPLFLTAAPIEGGTKGIAGVELEVNGGVIVEAVEVDAEAAAALLSPKAGVVGG